MKLKELKITKHEAPNKGILFYAVDVTVTYPNNINHKLSNVLTEIDLTKLLQLLGLMEAHNEINEVLKSYDEN